MHLLAASTHCESIHHSTRAPDVYETPRERPWFNHAMVQWYSVQCPVVPFKPAPPCNRHSTISEIPIQLHLLHWTSPIHTIPQGMPRFWGN